MKNYYLRVRRALIALVACVLVTCSFQSGVVAQTYPVQNQVQQMVNDPYVKGYYEWLPADYATSTKKYPVIIFFHGIGECGNGSTQLSRVLANGPPKLINEKKFPTTFTVNGQEHSFIVISPQFTQQIRNAAVFNDIVSMVKSKYRVDESRIYLTGLSMGGGLSWYYTCQQQAYAENFAAMAIVCGNINSSKPGIAAIANANLPIKIFHNDGDPTVPLAWSQNWFNGLSAYSPAMNPKPTLTIWSSTSHDAWSKAYDPNYKENNMNVYEWMLSQQRGGTTPPPPPVNKPPVINIPLANIAITLPIAQVTLNGTVTDADGTIASTVWTKLNGPAGGTITSPNSSSTTVTGLATGIYTFELTATDNNGGVTKAQIIVTVIAAPTGTACQANAGADQTIERGVASSAVLDGSGSTGSNLTYSWRLMTSVTSEWISNMKNTTKAKADAIILPYVDGGYSYELTVNNGAGCVSKDTTKVNVSWGRMPYKGSDGKGWHVATGADVAKIPTARVGDIIIDGANNGAIAAGNTEINISSTDQISLKGGQKVLIRGGRYRIIRLNFTPGTVRGTKANPVIITNYDGQVETGAMTISNVVGTKLTGRYVPGVSGDINYQGHEKGAYAFTRGKYGIFSNAAWGSLSSSGLRVMGTNTDSLEIEYMEIGNGHFAGMMIKEDGGTVDFNDFNIHDVYIHDIHGEGVYLGSTGADPQHLLNKLTFKNVRIVNAGNEIFQFGQVGFGSNVTNNVFINSANNRRSTFANYQDNGAQLAYRSGNQHFRNNILLGTGDAAFNSFIGSKTGRTAGNDSIYICNNLVKYGAGSLGAYFSGSSQLPTTVVKMDSNYFGGFSFSADEIYSDGRGVNSTTLIKIAGGLNFLFRNNKSDGTKSVLTTGAATLLSNAIAPINNPNFVNSGWPANYDYSKMTEWGDFIFNTWKDEFANPSGVKFNNAITFKAGEYVTFLSKTYRSKVGNNHGNVPHGKTDDYWELITWTGSGITYQFPPDDYRLVDGDEYKNRKIGLIDEVAVQPTPNKPPIADAGFDRIVTLPKDTVRLAGKGIDTDGTIASYTWTKISGPSLTATGANTASPVLSNLVKGVYLLELLVSDDKGATAKDTMQLTVNPAPNMLPEADAGEDIDITLPTNNATLIGKGTDADGTIVKYQWTKISGPTTFTIASPTTATTTVTGLVQGVYGFELTVTDDSTAIAKDTVLVTVGTVPVVPNKPPTANAGNDVTITLPTNVADLTGSGADTDGTIASYKWRKMSGPAVGNIANTNVASTQATALVQGVYEFELTVTDNKGATAKDVMKVTVLQAPNVLPEANAGTDITITLPVNTVILGGTGSDDDGAIATFHWKKISGPAAYLMADASSASTQVTGLTVGVYEFELTVTDDRGGEATDVVKVTVLEAPNVAPVAIAGDDQTAEHPIGTINLNGSASYDTDGQIVSYRWVKISGPSPFTMADPTSAYPRILSPTPGTYVLELTVTDNRGGTATDRVTVVVVEKSAENKEPHANAGTDVTINLPVTVTTLDGSASYDEDGYIAQYRWNQKSGPNFATIDSANSAKTAVKNMVEGTYVFELIVTDNLGKTSTATVKVTVAKGGPNPGEVFKVWPVPAHTVLNFSLTHPEIKNEVIIATVYDIRGVQVCSKRITGGQGTVSGQFNVSALRNGEYVLVLTSEDGSPAKMVKKFLVLHQ